MFSYVWPIALVVLSNTVYHLCAKSVSSVIHPLASLTITYLVSACCAAVLYFFLGGHGSILHEFPKANWASFVLGFVIVGLEAGYIYAYKAGWQVSTASIVQSSFLAVILILVGFLLFREAITWNKIVGVVICLIGLVFINLK